MTGCESGWFKISKWVGHVECMRKEHMTMRLRVGC